MLNTWLYFIKKLPQKIHDDVLPERFFYPSRQPKSKSVEIILIDLILRIVFIGSRHYLVQ